MKKEKLYLLIAAGVIILLIFIIMILGSFVELTEPGRAFLNNQMETLKMVLILLIGYYWGTSTSSANKTDIMAKTDTALAKEKDNSETINT